MRLSRDLVWLLVVFVATRALLLWLATDTGVHHLVDSSLGDVTIYERWARVLLREDLAAYRGVGIEYPPGSLPFFTAPLLVSAAGGYRTGFAVLMALVDAAGLLALVRLGRQGGSLRGAWAWVVGVPLLGPLAYARFDLVPAVATVWAVAAASTRHWFASGAWLGLGAAAKVYPGLLVPIAAWRAARGRPWRQPPRTAVLAGAALVCVAAVLPFVGSLPSVAESVLGYHAGRGLQIESVPSNLLLLGARLGWVDGLFGGFDHGAYHLSGTLTGPFALASGVAAIVSLVGVTVLLGRASILQDGGPGDGDWVTMAEGMLAVLLATMVTGKVLSPQFVLWPLALGAACLASTRTRLTWPAWALLPAVALTQLVFPWLYDQVQIGRWDGLMVLTTRNVLLVSCAVSSVLLQCRQPVSPGTGDAFKPPAAVTVTGDTPA